MSKSKALWLREQVMERTLHRLTIQAEREVAQKEFVRCDKELDRALGLERKAEEAYLDEVRRNYDKENKTR